MSSLAKDSTSGVIPPVAAMSSASRRTSGPACVAPSTFWSSAKNGCVAALGIVNGSCPSMPASTSRPPGRSPASASAAAAYDGVVSTTTSAPPASCSSVPPPTTWSAPSSRARSCLSGDRVTAIVWKPRALAYWTPR